MRPATRLRIALAVAFLLLVLFVWGANPVFQDLGDPTNFTIIEDELFTYTVATSDPDGEYPLLIENTGNTSAIKSFNMLVLNGTHALINFTPSNSEVTNATSYHIVYIIITDTADSYNQVQLRFNVTNVNDPPAILNYTPGNLSLNVTENSSLLFWYQYNTSDIDIQWGDVLNVSWYVDGVLNLTNSTQGEYWNYSLDLCQPTQRNFTLRASDLANLNSTINWTVNISNINRPPVFNLSNNMTNQTWNEDSNLTNTTLDLDDHFNDPDYEECFLNGLDGDNPTFTAEVLQGNGNITVSINTSAPHHITFIPDPDWTGIEVIRIVLNDTAGGIAYSNNFTLNVTNLYDPPVFSPGITDQIGYVDAPFTYDINATDSDGDTLNYTDNSTLFTINDTTGLISFTPNSSQISNYSIFINVSDGRFLINATFNLTILNNTAPILDIIANYTVVEGGTFQIDISGTDPDDDNLTFTTNRSEISVAVVNGTHSTITWSSVPDSVSNATHPILVTVRDIRNAPDTQVFWLNVTAQNFPPVLGALPNFTIRANKTLSYNLTASDFDDDTLVFNINATKVNYTQSSSTLANLNFSNGSVQEFTANISVTETDTGVSYQDSQIVWFNVTDNFAPTLYPIGEQACTEDAACYINLSSYANDSNTNDYYLEVLTYWTNASGFSWLTYDSSTGQILVNVTDSSDADKLYNISFNVSDDVLSTNSSFILNVTDANDAPYFLEAVENFTEWTNIIEDTLVIIPSTLVSAGAGPWVNATDEDGDDITFWMQVLVGPNTTLFSWNEPANGRGYINFTPRQVDVGNYSVNLTVSDPSGGWSGQIVNFTIQDLNSPPNITQVYPYGTPLSNATIYEFYNTTSLPDGTWLQNISEGTDLLFNHTTTDEEDHSLIYTWFLDGVNQTANISWTYETGYFSAGRHNVTLSVDDPYNTTSFTWNVTIMNVALPPIFGRKELKLSADFISGNFTNTTLIYPGNITLSTIDGENYTTWGTYESPVIDLWSDDGDGTATSLGHYILSNITYSTVIPALTEMYLEVRSNDNGTHFVNWTNWTASTNLSTGSNMMAFPGTKDKHIQYRLNYTSQSDSATPQLNTIALHYNISNYTITEGSSISAWLDLDDFFINPDPDCSDMTFSAGGYTSLSVSIDGSTNVATIASTVDSVNSTTTTTVIFTATCGNQTATSNEIPVTIVDAGQTRYITYTSSGGSGSTVLLEVPRLVETTSEEFLNLNLITPGSVIMYENDTVIAPIKLKNEGNRTVYGVTLSATSENPDVTMTYTVNYFSQIDPGQEEDTNLIITSYTTMGNYHITVHANISEPDSTDSAQILINSIEKGSYSPEEINTKIAFTRDLLSNNPQCLELNEMLFRAETAVGNEELDEAAELLSIVLENCRFLIAQSQKVQTDRLDFFESLYNRIFGSVPSSRTKRYFIITLTIFSLILVSVAFERVRIWERFKKKKKRKKPPKPRMQSV